MRFDQTAHENEGRRISTTDFCRLGVRLIRLLGEMIKGFFYLLSRVLEIHSLYAGIFPPLNAPASVFNHLRMSQISRGAGLFRTEIRRILSLLEKASDGRGRRGVWVWAISSDSHRPSPTVCDSAGLSSEGFCPPVARTEPVSPARPDGLSGELLDPEWSGAWRGRAVGGWHPAAHTLASCWGCC